MSDKSSLRHHAIATSHVSAALSQNKESLREKVTLGRNCIYVQNECKGKKTESNPFNSDSHILEQTLGTNPRPH